MYPPLEKLVCLITRILDNMVGLVYKKNMDEKYKSISKQYIDELAAIYQDYLYMSREHEAVLQTMSLDSLANSYLQDLRPDVAKFVWQFDVLTENEKRDFANFINADEYKDENRAYVILRHIKSQDNTGYFKHFAVPPYTVTSLCMELPSSIEQYTIIYPPTAKLGDVEFFIDGLYKAKYSDDEHPDMPVGDFIYDNKMLNEFTMVITLAEALRQDGNITDNKFERMLLNVYAAERVVSNENVMLELLGSFAEKLLVVCREMYKISDVGDVFRRAESEGLISSADDFKDYVNIRNFMRHQWDTLDDLGFFSTSKSNKNKIIRAAYAQSYLKLCDKTLIARMKSYIDVLHQMQHVIKQIAPDRIIRNNSESNNKFIQRVRAAYASGSCPSVEINHPLPSDKYKSLERNLHKVVPNVNIADSFLPGHGKDIGIDDYGNRSIFLQTFHATECMVMRHCILRGCNLRHYEAWEHIKNLGIISDQEYKTWQDYGALRNLISHNYFNTDLRRRLREQEPAFMNDAQLLMHKMVAMGPDVKKLSNGIYEYCHQDGQITRLDFTNHRVLYTNRPSIQKLRETFPNGMELCVYNGTITNVKLPNGMNIDLQNRTINWDEHTMWRTTKDNVNILQTAKSKIYLGPDLRVTKYMEQGSKIPFNKGDNILIDRRHNLVLDFVCRIKEFKFKNAANISQSTMFFHTKDGHNLISFSDGTTVTQSDDGMTITHNGITLTYDNRADFAMAYNLPQSTITPTHMTPKHVR